ncbi:ATP-binding protein [Nonomuraea insulae]|uniref:ATP-binding protein n=1 Tax=Nonomuraea insulae TaxID=1616787 RepID=A0ABW1CM99_9ACTN
MFTDIVGSTMVRAELGEEAGEEQRRAHDRLVREAVHAHGGTVVKGLGDGAMAVFAGASEALEAAVAVQRSALRVSQQESQPAPMQLRIGVSVGEVMWEQDDCFGTAVIEASRLCSAAGAGQILACDLVRVLTGGRLGPLFTSVGALELKGLAKPLETVEVAWRSEVGHAIAPLPAGLAREDRLPLVGREAERTLLTGEWKRVSTGERRAQGGGGRIVLVSGEPGVGKTRLVREVAGEVHNAGAIVLFGQCDEEMGIAYHPFVEALGEFVAACDDDQLRSLTGPLSGELAKLVPTLPDRVPGLAPPLRAEPETERYRLFESVVDLFAAMSTIAPVLLALDDLHWADAQTLLLLRHLLRSNEPMRLLVLGTFRDTDIDRRHQLMHLLPDLRRAGRGTRLPLTGLEEEDVAAMVAAAAARELDSEELEFAHHLHAETGGHPFCVEEVLLHFVETGTLLREGGRWASTKARRELGIPEGVREVVGQRLGRLPHSVREVLERASVIGQQFDVQLLAAVVDGGMGPVIEALESAEAARLITAVPGQGERYRFGHTLIRSCIYQDLPTTRRSWLHRTAGLALEQQTGNGTRLAELAIHFGEAAGVGEADRAVAYARQAGDLAMGKMAFEQAAAHYGRALAALELSAGRSSALVCDLQLAQAAALNGIGADQFRDVAFAAADTARSIPDTDRLASAALLLVHFGPSSPVINGREILLLEEALERLSTADSPARARLLAGLAAAYGSGRSQRAVLYSRQAVDMARRLGDPMVLARVLASQHTAMAGPDTSEEALEVARELVTLGERLGDPETRFAGHISCYTSLVAVCDIDAADQALDAGDALARELRQPIFAFHVLRLRTAQALLAGRVAEGEHLANAMRQKGHDTSIPPTILDAMLAGCRFLAREQQGRLAELEPEVAQLVSNQPGWQFMRIVHAHLKCLTGRQAAARPLMDQLKADAFAGITHDELWFETMVHLAAISYELADEEAAASLYALLAPYTRHNMFTGMGCFGPVDRVLALLATAMGRHGDAERHFRVALDMSRRLRAPGWAAYVSCYWAKLLTRLNRPGDRQRGQELAAQALTDATSLGLTGLAADLRELSR